MQHSCSVSPEPHHGGPRLSLRWQKKGLYGRKREPRKGGGRAWFREGIKVHRGPAGGQDTGPVTPLPLGHLGLAVFLLSASVLPPVT